MLGRQFPSVECHRPLEKGIDVLKVEARKLLEVALGW
jgi:hypothetical protein